jgi:NAD(P)-dependent dehydrogenase (short-subunit alcohol dehydrogenase family)
MSLPLEARTAVITGANQGLGREIATAYVQAGASVMLCARDATKLDAVRDELFTAARPDQRVLSMRCDVSVEEDVTQLIAKALEEFGRIHILVNNAGVYGPFGSIDEVNWPEWVRAMEININGSVLPTRALLPHFKQYRYGKIVQLSGGGATSPLPRITAYAASKAAIVRLMESLAEDVKGSGIDVNAIAPGALNTRMMDQLIAAGPEAVGAAFYDRMRQVAADGGTPLGTGAALAVFLGSPESDGITGRLLSAVWDPWKQLPEHRAELADSDIYTLRRIVPKDRGKDWDKR